MLTANTNRAHAHNRSCDRKRTPTTACTRTRANEKDPVVKQTMANSNIRAIVVGDGGVGKSCFIISWTAGVFPSGYVPTVFDNRVGDVVVDDESVGVLFWDTRESLHIAWLFSLRVCLI